MKKDIDEHFSTKVWFFATIVMAVAFIIFFCIAISSNEENKKLEKENTELKESQAYESINNTDVRNWYYYAGDKRNFVSALYKDNSYFALGDNNYDTGDALSIGCYPKKNYCEVMRMNCSGEGDLCDIIVNKCIGKGCNATATGATLYTE